MLAGCRVVRSNQLESMQHQQLFLETGVNSALRWFDSLQPCPGVRPSPMTPTRTPPLQGSPEFKSRSVRLWSGHVPDSDTSPREVYSGRRHHPHTSSPQGSPFRAISAVHLINRPVLGESLPHTLPAPLCYRCGDCLGMPATVGKGQVSSRLLETC